MSVKLKMFNIIPVIIAYFLFLTYFYEVCNFLSKKAKRGLPVSDMKIVLRIFLCNEVLMERVLQFLKSLMAIRYEGKQ